MGVIKKVKTLIGAILICTYVIIIIYVSHVFTTKYPPLGIVIVQYILAASLLTFAVFSILNWIKVIPLNRDALKQGKWLNPVQFAKINKNILYAMFFVFMAFWINPFQILRLFAFKVAFGFIIIFTVLYFIGLGYYLISHSPNSDSS